MAVLKNTVNIGDMQVTGELTASKISSRGGTSSQFVKGDGSLDSNSYATTSSLGNYLPLSGGTLTGNLNVDGKIDSAGNHEHIPITLCKIAGDNGTEIYLGIPSTLADNIDWSAYTLTYVRYSKYYKYKNKAQAIKIRQLKWHKMKYPTEIMNERCPEWVESFPNDIIKFDFDDVASVGFVHLGYNYYLLKAYYVESDHIETTTRIDDYVNMDYENNGIGLPYVFTSYSGAWDYRTAGRLMDHNKCGLCLMDNNDEIVSNIALLRTYSAENGIFGVAVKNK